MTDDTRRPRFALSVASVLSLNPGRRWSFRPPLSVLGVVMLSMLTAAPSIAQIVVSAEATTQDSPSHQANKTEKSGPKETVLTKEARLAFIQRAQVWSPTSITEMDIRTGPQGEGAFQPNEMVTCDYVGTKELSGSSRKFACAVAEGDIVKVRYGPENGEVEGQVLAGRLLWALGFGADRTYPVRVSCKGCSDDPWNKRARVSGTHVFDPATIERPPPGHEMKQGTNKAGWSWSELDLVDEGLGGAPKAQRDALKLLAVFMQHTDTKSEQQRLVCLPQGFREDGSCDRPFMALHDVGLTFGHASYFNRSAPSSVNFDEWSKTPVWRDRAGCVGHLSKSATGTLGDPRISEAGRKFLAELLAQLSDSQVRDLFEVARVDRRSRKPNSSEPPASVDEWVAAFKQKVSEIVKNHCPS